MLDAPSSSLSHTKKEIVSVSFNWHEMSSVKTSSINNGTLYRVICILKDSHGLTVEGSHIFIISDLSLSDKQNNDLAFTAESAAYNNAVQCLLAASSAYGNI